jgi:DNA mismatch endonuclease (patch repair protein)
MGLIRSHNNKSTENAFILQLKENEIVGWRRGKKIYGKPDFVFRKLKLAVFIDGCFWHGCKKHYRNPKGNRIYWTKKISKNKFRDNLVNKVLKKMEWRILRIWEHDIPNKKGIMRLNKIISVQKIE